MATEMRTGTWEPSLRETVIFAEMWPRDSSNSSTARSGRLGSLSRIKKWGEDELVGRRSGFDFAYTHCLRILG